MPDESSKTVTTVRVDRQGTREVADDVATEEPLEIRIGTLHGGTRVHKSVSITMRTPGHDAELAVGFLYTEGILHGAGDVERVAHCGPRQAAGASNTIRVELRPGVEVDFGRLERHFYTSSSCGVCGKTSIEALTSVRPPELAPDTPLVNASVIHGLPQKQRQAQDVFERTGSLHAAALFDCCGNLLELREDVGRHNALDKLIGSCVLRARVPLSSHIVLFSGRASFELVQKSIMAGIPILASVGAPSSLAVELARQSGATLLGFVRQERFNIYSGQHRITLDTLAIEQA